MREVISLNYNWNFLPEFSEKFLELGFDGQLVDVPHTVKMLPLNNFDETSYQFLSSYSNSFEVVKSLGKRYLLAFDAVAHIAKVYVNGSYVGEHRCGYTAFEFDVTEQIKSGMNKVFVLVDSREDGSIPPFGFGMDYICYGGIYREVRLNIVNEHYIDDIFVTTPNVTQADKSLYVEVSTNSNNQVKLNYEVYDGANIVADFSSIGSFLIKQEVTISNVINWDTTNPKLYTLKVQMVVGDIVVDEKNVSFGFRTAKFTTKGFFLNGKQIKLVGLNRHQSYPYIGYAAPKSLQEMDAEFVKNTLGCNIVRTAHYPQSQHFVNKCDELGLLVFTEIPGWDHIGNDEWKDLAVKNTEEMVKQYRNHPSIILWGVRINESDDCDELYSRTNAMAHKLDSSRQTGGVRCHKKSSFLEDVYTYNDFVHSGANHGLDNVKKVAGKRVPYLVSEHNGHMFSTKSFDNSAKRLSNALRHLRVIDSAFADEGKSGCIGWCMSDYNTHKEFGSGDKVCYHGVSDMFRLPKLSAYAYMSQMSQKAVLMPSDNRDLGDFDEIKPNKLYIFTNCDCVKIYNNDFLLGTYYPNRKLFPNLPHPPIVIDNLFEAELVRDFGYTPKRAKFIANAAVNLMREPSIINYLKAGWMLLSSGKNYNYWRLIMKKYVTRWACSDNWRIDGYINNEVAKTYEFGASGDINLVVDCAKKVVEPTHTYQMFKVDAREYNAYGNLVNFVDDIATISLEGEGSVVGDSTGALIGGGRSFFVSTKIKKGHIIATVTTSRGLSGKVVLEVK